MGCFQRLLFHGSLPLQTLLAQVGSGPGPRAPVRTAPAPVQTSRFLGQGLSDLSVSPAQSRDQETSTELMGALQGSGASERLSLPLKHHLPGSGPPCQAGAGSL